jgi:ADP-heptose:LPS heptosyltransferase
LPDWSRVRRLLVLRLDNLGDVVMTGPALRAIKTHHPQLHLTLLASPLGAPAAALLPWVDELRVHRALWQDLGRLPFDPAREAAFIATLRAGAYDAALILTSFSQSPHPAALACALAGIPVRIASSHERGSALTFALPAAPDNMHQVERNLRLVEAVGLPADDRQLALHIPDTPLENLQDPKNVAETVRFLLTMPPESVIPELMVIPMRETSWP